MPTGYTAPIKDGITFQKFALRCARAFGACVEMRDESSDTPIPEEFKPSDYHLNARRSAEMQLKTLSNMSVAAAEKKAEADFQAATQSRNKRIKEDKALLTKYNFMLSQVQKWPPPTPEHVEFKNFMISQIEESIRFDCGTSYYTDHPIVKLSGEEWLRISTEKEAEDIIYHSKHYKEEVDRTNSRNAWVKSLRQSLE